MILPDPQPERRTPPTWGELLSGASSRLGDPAAARWLVEKVSGLAGARLATSLSLPAVPSASARLDRLVSRVVAAEPLQYVLGHWAFRTLDLEVGPAALVPRPETEVVVEVALGELRRGIAGRRVADLGTGTGAIALSIAVEAPGSEVFATDRSPEALALAARNLARTGAGDVSRVVLSSGDWYGALPPALAGTFDLVVSNPPYLAEDELSGLGTAVRDHEPVVALVAGPTGLEAVEVLVSGAVTWLAPAGSLVVEIAPAQASAAAALAVGAGFAEALIRLDLAGRDRVLVARR